MPIPFVGKKCAKLTCGHVFKGVGEDTDLVECPRCGTQNATGHESRFRSQFETPRSSVRYPKAAAGRAIAYASAIYGLATHSQGIDFAHIEDIVGRRLGASLRVDPARIELLAVGTRGAKGAEDHSAGWLIVVVRGTSPVSSGKPRDWTLIYVVFRGSRGDLQGAKNPNGAGWGDRGDGPMNIDWRSNFDGQQVKAHWAADCRVHKGISELFASTCGEIVTHLKALVAKHPHPQVIVTGHSLGAGLATLCAHHLQRKAGISPFCFAFCSPRVGNLAFVRDFNHRLAAIRGRLWSEFDEVNFTRSVNFYQWNDPISGVGLLHKGNTGKHGFRSAMSDSIADSGSIAKQGGMAKLKRTTGEIIYYHAGNLYNTGTGMHEFTAMQRAILGE